MYLFSIDTIDPSQFIKPIIEIMPHGKQTAAWDISHNIIGKNPAYNMMLFFNNALRLLEDAFIK